MGKKALQAIVCALCAVMLVWFGCSKAPAPPPVTTPAVAQAAYKCASCGKTKTLAAADAVPSC